MGKAVDATVRKELRTGGCDPMLPGWTYELTLPTDATTLSAVEIAPIEDKSDVLWSRSGLDLKLKTTYELQISHGDETGGVHVQFNTIDEQEHGEAPSEAALIVALVAAVLLLLYTIAKMKPSASSSQSNENASAHLEPLLPKSSPAERDQQQQQQQPLSMRLESLDVFRGLTICLMIFVNYGGQYSTKLLFSGAIEG